MIIENLLENLVIEVSSSNEEVFKLLHKLEFKTCASNLLKNHYPKKAYFLCSIRKYLPHNTESLAYIFYKFRSKENDLLLLKDELIIPILKECNNLEDVNIVLNIAKQILIYKR